MEKRNILKNKNGLLGLDTVKTVILSLLVLAVLVVAVFAILVPLRQSAESVDRGGFAIKIVNETIPVLASGTDTIRAFIVDNATREIHRNPTCTIIQMLNLSAADDDWQVISSGNYTTSSNGCTITRKANGVSAVAWNATAWAVTYTYTEDDPMSYNLEGNITTGSGKFFSNVPTFFVLLGVIVLILIIAIVIVSVTRFNAEGTERVGRGRESGPNV